MSRLRWAVVAALAAAILITARLLPPSASGHGTHMALGLPACPFLRWTGLPCPTCGLTTGFALLARGDVMQALRVHPMSLPLFSSVLAVAVLAALGAAGAAVRPRAANVERWAWLMGFGLLTSWLARLALRSL